MNNNILLYVLTLFFISLAFMSVFVNDEFNAGINENNPDVFDEVGQVSLIDTTAFNFLSSLLFWVLSAPVWVNLLILSPLRIVFAVILYDKIRGI